MSLKFNINRPRVSDEEIEKHQDFDKLVKQFKEQSLKKARGDESWWKNKMVRYSTVIAGITVVCTVTYLSLTNDKKQQSKTNETLITQKAQTKNNSPESKSAAQRAKTSRSFIQAPSQKLNIEFSRYTVNNSKGGQINHSTSSKIKIPKNSFVDKNGRDIVGDVTIEYREFHDLGDVIVSGIPMGYDSAGTTYNLESAGMFDIRGYQNDQAVFIKPEKKLQVELASHTSEDRFNQYYLDTVSKNWQYLKRDKLNASPTAPVVSVKSQKNLSNAKIDALTQRVEKIIPKRIDSLNLTYKNKVEKLPLAKEPSKPVKSTPGRPNFEIESDHKDYPELAAFDHVLFEVGRENKNYTPELHEVTWSDLKISQGPVKGKNYLLTLIYRNRQEKLIVYPVLSDADYQKASLMYEEKLNNYQDLLAKRVAEEKRLLAEMEAKQAAYLAEQKKIQAELQNEKAKLLASFNAIQQNELASNFNTMSKSTRASRLFEVSRFGIFNSDCPHTVPGGKVIEPVFVSSEKNRAVLADQIYLVDHSRKQVFMLDRDRRFKMSLANNTDYSLCLFKGSQLFICNKKAFKEMLGAADNKFVVTPVEDQADNLADFKKVLEIY